MTTIANVARATTPLPDTAVRESVGDAIARALADMGVTTAFGVISIHNMPILDAIAVEPHPFRAGRGKAGAMNMADAYARVSRSLGVVITSTGTAAGNAAGSQVEALTAGSPVLHITTQVDREFVDRDRAAIHDVPRQPDMLKAISKSYVRVWESTGAVDALVSAARDALTAPTGPVTLEIPVDVQRVAVPVRTLPGAPAIIVRAPDAGVIDAVAERVRRAKRPMLWLGGGARGAAEAATALANRGFGIVTSTQGRAVVPENHAHSLGAFNMTPEALAIYAACDLMIVVGSRLRGNETQNNRMPLPPLVQIDTDVAQAGRNYTVELFVHADAKLALEALLALLPDKLDTDPASSPASARHAPKPKRRCATSSAPTRRSPIAWANAYRRAGIRGCATSPSPTAPSAIAMSASPPRISACTRLAAASARASPWASAPPSPGNRPRPSRCSATAGRN